MSDFFNVSTWPQAWRRAYILTAFIIMVPIFIIGQIALSIHDLWGESYAERYKRESHEAYQRTLKNGKDR
jgi:hypothetical protein